MPIKSVEIPIRAKLDFKTVQISNFDDGPGRKFQIWSNSRGQNSNWSDFMLSKMSKFSFLTISRGQNLNFVKLHFVKNVQISFLIISKDQNFNSNQI